MNHTINEQFDAIDREYRSVVQAAGLPMHLLDARDEQMPDDHRRALVKRLQQTLPRTTPASIRAAPSPQMSGDWLAQTEAKVKAAVIEQAHQSETLRPVVSRDRTGREQTEFYGQKRSWMRQFSAPALLMKRCGNASF